MTTLRKAAEAALEALQKLHSGYHMRPGRGGADEAFAMMREVVAALRAALAEQEQPCPQCEKYKTVMIAAAEEINAHWDAHCDAEGYGPANLMRRLEDGIPAEYGYTAGRFSELQQEVKSLKKALAEQSQSEPVAWITEEPNGNDRDGSYSGICRDVVFGAKRPDFGVTPLYTTPPAPQPLTKFPPLPEPHATVDIWGHDCPHYTREQMRAYARAVEAEILRRMKVNP